jgi:hypothetical protein
MSLGHRKAIGERNSSRRGAPDHRLVSQPLAQGTPAHCGSISPMPHRPYAEELGQLRLRWTNPIGLKSAVLGQGVPALPGLYRIRRIGLDGWDYLGQTGSGTMNLRKRMAMLKGVYHSEMPYRDPHTAGPGLWALRHQSSTPFEVAFCAAEGSTPWRKGLEAVAIAVHRQEHDCSPTLNFGRMPPGYRMSSANNARLTAAGQRFRGGPREGEDEAHAPGIPPPGPLSGEVRDGAWCGHRWSTWAAIIPDALPSLPPGNGIYRISGRGVGLVYIGEGLVRGRLQTHLAKLQTATRQGAVFAENAPLAFSFAMNREWLRHQRLELETDLIAAHVLSLHKVPPAQFVG